MCHKQMLIYVVLSRAWWDRRCETDRKEIWFGSCYGQMFPLLSLSSLPCRDGVDTNEKGWTADSTLLCCFVQTGVCSFGLNYREYSVIYSSFNLMVMSKNTPKNK